jgi:hypothetical protein
MSDVNEPKDPIIHKEVDPDEYYENERDNNL